MAKESISASLSKILLGEFSKKVFASSLAVISLPALFSLLMDSITTILQDLMQKPIAKWQLSVWLFLLSTFLIYSFLLYLLAIKVYKRKESKRQFLLFENEGYCWKMLLPGRKLSSTIPLCPKHQILLTSRDGDYYKCSIPECEIKFPNEERWKYHDNAYAVGIAILDGHLKR